MGAAPRAVAPLPATIPALTFRDLVRTARPLLWLNSAALWIVALLVMARRPSLADLLMVAYFTFPFNLWLHGINDVYDYASDRLNPRKGGDEGALLPPQQHRAMGRALLLWNLPVLPLALWQSRPLGIALLLLFLALGWAYSAPPIRAKSRPFLDGLFNVAYLLPYAIALGWHGAPAPLWRASLPALLAFAAWAIASHAFTAIQDIEADRTGGIRTVATVLGARGASWLALGGYLLAAVAAARYGWPWGLLVAGYPLLVLHYLGAPGRARANRLYRLFILLNSTLGFILIVRLALADGAHTGWAAALTLSLVALVAVARWWSVRPAAPAG